MRSLLPTVSVLLFVFDLPFVHAQFKTDAQRDGLSGPVKSVSTAVAHEQDVKWQQPDGPMLVTPIWCHDCEYDPDGSKTKSGLVMEGKFVGDRIRLVRDGEGKVIERYSYSSSGELERHDFVGPFGTVEQKVYIGGKLRFRDTYAYDEFGNLTEVRSFDAAGNSLGYTLTTFTKEGKLLKRSAFSKDDKLAYEQTYDPESETEHFTTYDEFGKVRLTWTFIKGKLTSFWEPADSPQQLGDRFSEPDGEGNTANFACHNDLHCDVSHIHYEYLNGDKHTPLAGEWRDAEGNLKMAAYFEYEVDRYHNWTTRRVFIWNPEVGNRIPFETDARAITYWK